MKKSISILLVFILLFSLVSCGSQPSSSETQSNAPTQTEQSDISSKSTENSSPSPDSSNEDVTDSPSSSESSDESQDPSNTSDHSTSPSDFSYDIDLEGVTTLDELEDRIEEDLESAITSLTSQWETLSAEIDSYEKYCDNSEKITAFYETIETNTELMCIMLKEYTAAYARMVLDSDMTNEKKYKAIDGINDEIYDDACDEINDEIYDGLLDDMNNHLYKSVLDKCPDNVEYSDWYDVISKEYSQWYDTASRVYSLSYDTASDIYSFYYDMSGELYSDDIDRAEKKYEKFLQKIAKDKGLDTGDSSTNASFDTTLRTANSIEKLEDNIEAHISECVQALKNEWENLTADINTYEKYVDNIDAIEEFHSHIEEAASQILVMVCNYGISYAELILQSGSSTKDQYKSFEDFKDCIYDDACDIVKEEIYEDLLEDVKDYYYDGIISDAKDSVSYSDWSDTHSNAYSWWSDARREVYSTWSDTRSDIYKFFTEIRSELYSGDSEGANDELQDFIKKVDKMR